MKHILAVLLLFSPFALSQTVIDLSAVSTESLEGNQQIYITTQTGTLIKQKIMKNKDGDFYAQEPWTKRDYVPQETDDFTVGSHAWCKAYIPWSEGLTFDMISWQRACDTNNDGKYDENDDRWED